MKTCRLVLCTESLSKARGFLCLQKFTMQVISAARSRCLPIRVPAPAVKDIVDILCNVAKLEGLLMPTKLAERIAVASDRNLRRSLLLAEVARAQHYPYTCDQTIQLPDWQNFIADTASCILSEQSPRRRVFCRIVQHSFFVAQRRVGCVHVSLFIVGLFQFYIVILLLRRVLEIRGRLYELLAHCVPPDVIFRVRLFPNKGISNHHNFV